MTGEEAQSTASQAEQPPSSIAASALSLRKAEPYWYDYGTWCKQRWIGRELLEVFTTEFRDRTKEYYLWAIHQGVCTVNGHRAEPRQRLQNGDRIVNRVHRHEPPVTAERVRILHRDDPMGLLVVVKPGSIPVHAAGRYFKHTLLEMLKSDHGLDGVYTLNRLDRLTSGIMVLATRKDAATKLGKHFAQGTVQKHYVCRVQGRFPASQPALAAASTPSAILSTLQAAQAQDQQAAAQAGDDGGRGSEFALDLPILGVDRQSGVCIVHPQGKECTTLFTRLRYDAASDTSVVWCRPITGRTHQIRVHVQYLGHPIVNDPIYAHAVWRAGGRSQLEISRSDIDEAAWKGEGGTGSTGSEKVDAVIAAIKLERDGREDWARWKDEIVYGHLLQQAQMEVPEIPGVNAGTARPAEVPAQGGEEEAKVLRELGLELNSSTRKWQKTSTAPVLAEGEEPCGMCDECNIPLQPDPKPEELFIYLHAMKYETDEWSFEDQMPWWASEEWQPTQSREKQVNGSAASATPEGAAIAPAQAALPENEEQHDAAPLAAVKPSSATPYASDTQWRRLVELPIKHKGQPPQPTDCPVPLLFSTFEGLEDIAELDLRQTLDSLQPASGSSASLQAWYLSGSVLAAAGRTSSDLLAAWDGGLIRSASSAHLVLGQANVSRALAEQLTAEKLSLGVSRSQQIRENRQFKEIVQKEGPERDARLAAIRARNWRKDQLAPSEDELLAIIRSVWEQGTSQRDQALATWKRMSGKESGAFRVRFERNGYALPTMTSAAIERELSTLVWPWLNAGKAIGDEGTPWSVNLLQPDLIVDFRLIPHWGIEGDELGYVERGAAGGLMISIELPTPRTPIPLQPREAKPYFEGGTPLAYYRSYLLSSLLPVPIGGTSKINVWDPCVGFGRIATELRAALGSRKIAHKVWGTDVDEDSIQRAEAVSAICQLSSDEMQVYAMDSGKIAEVAALVGGEGSLDGVVTDLPWGHRILTKAMLTALYRALLASINAMLKPGAHAILMTAEVKLLRQCIDMHEHAMRKYGHKTCLRIAPLELEQQAEGGEEATQARRAARTHTTAAGGVRQAKSGYAVGLFDLRKEPL